MTFEILYENYQITIYYCKNEEENEEEKNDKNFSDFLLPSEGVKGNTTNGNDSIKINILDMDTMYKYETKINSYEDLDKLPEFMQNLEVISNMICSALEKKSNSVKCSLIKEDGKIILDIVYQTEFFKIPFKIPVFVVEGEGTNIIFERKIRKIQIKNKELEQKLSNLQIKYFMESEIKDNEINKFKIQDSIYNKQIKSYNKISSKFPHLSFEQVIKFDEKLRNNGGSLLCHNGNFIDCMFPAMGHHLKGHAREFYIKCWDCCPIYKTYQDSSGTVSRFKTLFKPKKIIKNCSSNLLKNRDEVNAHDNKKCDFIHDYQNFNYKGFIKSITKDGLLSYSGDFEDDEITVIYANFHMNSWGIPTHKSYDEVLTKKGKQLRETGALDYLKCQETMQNPMPDSYCFCGGKEFSIKEFL